MSAVASIYEYKLGEWKNNSIFAASINNYNHS
jgi:hypothetical protein